jgi:hypothetical protein
MDKLLLRRDDTIGKTEKFLRIYTDLFHGLASKPDEQRQQTHLVSDKTAMKSSLAHSHTGDEAQDRVQEEATEEDAEQQADEGAAGGAAGGAVGGADEVVDREAYEETDKEVQGSRGDAEQAVKRKSSSLTCFSVG